MKKSTKALAVTLALAMTASLATTVFAEEPVDPYAGMDHAEVSDELYMEVLGEFDENYAAAFEAETVSERWAYMAIAEAKLLESGIMLPSTSRGGNFAISKIAPYTVSPCLWGNDEYRYQNAVIIDGDMPITAEQYGELRALWAEKRGTGEYNQAAKDYLTEKGYSFSDTLTMTYTSDPQTWDAFNTYRQADTEAIIKGVTGLLEYDGENVQQPALAAEMPEVSEDGLKYTFKIREGVNWTDSQGKVLEPVTANSFVAGFHHLLDAQGGLEYLVWMVEGADAYMYGETVDFEDVGVKALDDYTLEYTLSEPCSYFLTMFSYNVFFPMSEVMFEQKGGVYGVTEWADAVEAGTVSYGATPDDIGYCGPYLVTSYAKENSISFEANPEYYDYDNMNVKAVNWVFNDGKNPTFQYDQFKEGKMSSAILGTDAMAKAKSDGMFDDYAYISLTDATSFPMFLNLYRCQYGNYDDASVAPTTMSDLDKVRTNLAMQNHAFRLAVCTGLDRGAYNAAVMTDETKYNNLVNSYTPGNFVFLEEEVTIMIGDEEKTYAPGTFYGQIMQDQIDADGGGITVWDPEANDGAGSSSGFDGWYNPEISAQLMGIAVEQLAEEGVVIDEENPIILEMPYYDISEQYSNRAAALEQSIEASTGKLVDVVLVKTGGDSALNWYNAGYYPETGDTMNYNIVDVCGWGPDFGDPQTYLDTMLGQPGGMAKNIGLY